MNKKIIRKEVSAADDLFSSLLDDVGNFDGLTSGTTEFPDAKKVLEDTVYGYSSKNEEVSPDILIPSFKDEDPNGLPILSDPKYDGPESDDNFLDQIMFNISSSKDSNDENKSLAAKDKASITLDKINKANKADQLPAISEKLDSTEIFFPPKQEEKSSILPRDIEKTIAVTKFAQRQQEHLNDKINQEILTSAGEDKVFVMPSKAGKFNSSQVSIDASLAQSESLRIAQNRIIDLEKEIERLRQENDELLTASEIIRNKSEEFTIKISQLEKENSEIKSDLKNEISLLKGNLIYKESENTRLQEKNEELELRIKNDFKKIRVRERELENRLELIKIEKQAVIKSKDDLLLELQRKNDISKSELETYRNKVQELNKSIESYKNQIKITVRTLRLALSHVDDKGENEPVHYKKAT